MKNVQRNTIQNELEALGIIAETIKEDGRTFQGKGALSRDGAQQTCFFKVAKTTIDKQRLHNSAQFVQQLEKDNPPFPLPRVLASGTLPITGLYFKVESLVEGTPFAIIEKGIAKLQVPDPESYFPAVVKALTWLNKPRHLYLLSSFDGELTNPYAGGDVQLHMLSSMIQWAQYNTPRLLELLKIVQASKGAFIQSVTHGDLTPINTIVMPENHMVGFVDLDLGNIMAPRYYDFAEFYNRLWTRVCKPELATAFLKETLASLDDQQKENQFLHEFLVLCAFRSVGNFYEISVLSQSDDRQKRLEYATTFVDHIVDRTFVEKLV
jgi:hypothetical protein